MVLINRFEGTMADLLEVFKSEGYENITHSPKQVYRWFHERNKEKCPKPKATNLFHWLVANLWEFEVGLKLCLDVVHTNTDCQRFLISVFRVSMDMNQSESMTE